MKSAKANNQIVIAYVPVLHAGYRAFFERQAKAADHLYVLGAPFIREIDQLRKEIRALEPNAVVTAVTAWDIFKQVEVLDKKILATLPKNISVVLPDEDVSREFAKRYLGDATVTFTPVFLRWDRDNSEREREIREDAKITRKAFDRKILAKAHQAAKHSSDWWRRVGAIVVKDSEILIETANQQRPSPHTSWADGDPRNNFSQGDRVELSTSQHAESVVMSEAARRGVSLEGADLYVTDFPCPPCAKLIAYSGIKRLFFEHGYAVLDGQRIIKQNGIEIIRVEDDSPQPKDPETYRPYPKKPKR
jgi:dCMP deaminase